jgi:hypothetical protein
VVWQLVLAVGTILGVLFTGQVLIDYAYAGHRLAWWRGLAVALTQWYVWAILSPAIVWLARRFRIDRQRWPRSLLVHVPASLVCTVIKQIADAAAAAAIPGVLRGPFSFIVIEMAFLTYQAIGTVELRFDPDRFVRIHRSLIVNIDRVKQLVPTFHGEYEIELRDGTRLSSGRSYSDRLQALVKGRR